MSWSTEVPAIGFYVIGGYLGAGKTTLLNHLLRQPELTNTTVLVNDFGKINIDAELIDNADGQTWRLENGCICCNIGQTFFTTLLRIVKSTPRPKRIIIEASGVSDPARIADIGRLSPSMVMQKIVVLVDCASVRRHASDKQIDTMVHRQLECADLILLNKRDLIENESVNSLVEWIRGLNTDADIIACEQARVVPAEIFGNKFETPLTADEFPASDLVDLDDVIDRHSLVDWVVDLPDSIDEVLLASALEALPATVHRVKGFISSGESGGWRLVQYTPGQARITRTDQEPAETMRGKLMFIGTCRIPESQEFKRMLHLKQRL